MKANRTFSQNILYNARYFEENHGEFLCNSLN
jgi:hypothetical protein